VQCRHLSGNTLRRLLCYPPQAITTAAATGEPGHQPAVSILHRHPPSQADTHRGRPHATCKALDTVSLHVSSAQRQGDVGEPGPMHSVSCKALDTVPPTCVICTHVQLQGDVRDLGFMHNDSAKPPDTLQPACVISARCSVKVTWESQAVAPQSSCPDHLSSCAPAPAAYQSSSYSAPHRYHHALASPLLPSATSCDDSLPTYACGEPPHTCPAVHLSC
jgi:hypothetical protein